QPVETFSGTRIAVDAALGETDIVILPAFWGNFDALCRQYQPVLPSLRHCHAGGTGVWREATGVFWRGAAGLLDAKEATTHWRLAAESVRRSPRVHFTAAKFMSDSGDRYCARGTTSACDLYRYLAERSCGANIAK